MRLYYTERFRRSYVRATTEIQERCGKQIALLAADLRHPSLHAKKYDESRGIWQARITRSWRLYFLIEKDVYYLLDLMAHPK